MTRGPRSALLAALALVASSAIALAAPMATVQASSTVDFDRPGAKVAFPDSITWGQDFTSSAVPARVELMTRLDGTETWVVREVPVERTGGTTQGGATYRAELADAGFVLPNSRVHYRFRVTTPSGPETGPEATVKVADDRVDWRTIEGDVVRLHWHAGGEIFAKRALRIAEDAIARTSTLLGVTETEPIDFFVYGDKDLFQTALGPGTKEFVAGRSVNEIRTLFAEIEPGQIGSDWVSIVIPHELTHLVFDTATRNAFHDTPHWLNEGLATYLSEGYGSDDRQRLANAIERGTLMPLSAIDDGFPSARQELFYLGYAEGTSAIDFFVRQYGEPKLVQLIRSWAAGVTDDDAFRAATGDDVAAFEAAWLADIGASTPVASGPRAAPPGVLPPGWTVKGQAVSTTAPSAAPQAASSPAPAAATQGDGITGIIVAIVAALSLLLVAVGILARGRRRAGARAGEPDRSTADPSEDAR